MARGPVCRQAGETDATDSHRLKLKICFNLPNLRNLRNLREKNILKELAHG